MKNVHQQAADLYVTKLNDLDLIATSFNQMKECQNILPFSSGTVCCIPKVF